MLTFPPNPSLGQEAVTGGKTWRWDGRRWQNVGVVGYQGSAGYQGSTGYQGSVGYTGSEGQQGQLGYQGSQGDPGGPQGYTGSQGYQGVAGYSGSAGKTRLRDLEDVDIAGQANGYLVTYNTDSDKYLVLPIDLNFQALDGGSF